MNKGPDSRCELCCGWGHIENMFGSKPKCGYCSGHHQARDVRMGETETETTTRTATDTETEIGTEALTTNDQRDPAHLRKVIRPDHCGAGDGSRTQRGHCVLASPTESKWRDWDEPFGIRNKKKIN